MMMSKYESLWKHLKADGSPVLKLSFEEIKTIIGFDIDHSFLIYKKEGAQFGYQAGKISMHEGEVHHIQQRRIGVGNHDS
jgi:23S rRNA G2445 N2-methylase RlmL